MNKKTVFIVEDDRAIRESLETLFSDEGYEVFSAENGKVALDRLRAGLDPDLILLDLMMPVMSGYEFLDERSKDAALQKSPLVLLSATQDAKKVAQAYGCSMIKKPVDLHQLLQLSAQVAR